MRLSYYWSLISSWHCQSSCGSWGDNRVDPETTCDNAVTKSIVNSITDTWETDVTLFFNDNRLSNCPLSPVDASHKSKIHVSVRLLTVKTSQWAPGGSTVIVLYRQWANALRSNFLTTYFSSSLVLGVILIHQTRGKALHYILKSREPIENKIHSAVLFTKFEVFSPRRKRRRRERKICNNKAFSKDHRGYDFLS